MPGLNFKAPFVTTLDQVVIRPETTTLESITAITRDGISNTFHDIQVISYAPEHMIIPLIKGYGRNFKKALVFDRIRSQSFTSLMADFSLHLAGALIEHFLEGIAQLSTLAH